MDLDLTGRNPYIRHDRIQSAGAELVVAPAAGPAQVDAETVDHLEDAVHPTRIVARRALLAKAPHRAAQRDRADPVRKHGDRPRIADPRIEVQGRPDVLFDPRVPEHRLTPRHRNTRRSPYVDRSSRPRTVSGPRHTGRLRGQ